MGAGNTNFTVSGTPATIVPANLGRGKLTITNSTVKKVWLKEGAGAEDQKGIELTGLGSVYQIGVENVKDRIFLGPISAVTDGASGTSLVGISEIDVPQLNVV